MACANVEQAAAIQKLLNDLGLVGQKLAESKGSEESLAVQVGERLGLEYEDWHVEYVKALVGAARQMADLERRMQGSEEAEGAQRVRDARAFEESFRGERRGEERRQAEAEVRVLPPRGTLGKSVRLRTGRVITEEEALHRIVG